MNIFLLNETGSNNTLNSLASRWQLVHTLNKQIALVLTAHHLELRKRDEPFLRGVFVDFMSSTMNYRRKFGGGRKEAIAKAVGIKANYFPDVIDATAGLGRDAFILAANGCSVRMIERNAVLAALIDDGLQRAYADIIIGAWLRERLTLIHDSSIHFLKQEIIRVPDVIYIDPMYPSCLKKSLVKKEMRIIQSLLLNEDKDENELLEIARKVAKKRVVVKRPSYAPPLAGIVTYDAVVTKKHRFDIYSPIVNK